MKKTEASTAILMATDQLNDAVEEYNARLADEQAARTATTSALNKLNEAQRQFDTVIQKWRNHCAPRGSDWQQEKLKPFTAVSKECGQGGV